MKKLIFNTMMAAAVVAAVSCNNGQKSNASDSTAAVQENPGETPDSTAANSTMAKDSSAKDDDTKFALEAANGGLFEVEVGKLAQNKAISPQVMKLANMMVADHSKANNELKTIASGKNITIPAVMSEKFQKEYDELSKMDRQGFDKAYTDKMVEAHKEDIDKFKAEADKGKDADLKAFAAKHVPILQHHLQMAEDAKKVADAKK